MFDKLSQNQGVTRRDFIRMLLSAVWTSGIPPLDKQIPTPWADSSVITWIQPRELSVLSRGLLEGNEWISEAMNDAMEELIQDDTVLDFFDRLPKWIINTIESGNCKYSLAPRIIPKISGDKHYHITSDMLDLNLEHALWGSGADLVVLRKISFNKGTVTIVVRGKSWVVSITETPDSIIKLLNSNVSDIQREIRTLQLPVVTSEFQELMDKILSWKIEITDEVRRRVGCVIS